MFSTKDVECHQNEKNLSESGKELSLIVWVKICTECSCIWFLCCEALQTKRWHSLMQRWCNHTRCQLGNTSLKMIILQGIGLVQASATKHWSQKAEKRLKICFFIYIFYKKNDCRRFFYFFWPAFVQKPGPTLFPGVSFFLSTYIPEVSLSVWKIFLLYFVFYFGLWQLSSEDLLSKLTQPFFSSVPNF